MGRREQLRPAPAPDLAPNQRRPEGRNSKEELPRPAGASSGLPTTGAGYLLPASAAPAASCRHWPPMKPSPGSTLCDISCRPDLRRDRRRAGGWGRKLKPEHQLERRPTVATSSRAGSLLARPADRPTSRPPEVNCSRSRLVQLFKMLKIAQPRAHSNGARNANEKQQSGTAGSARAHLATVDRSRASISGPASGSGRQIHSRPESNTISVAPVYLRLASTFSNHFLAQIRLPNLPLNYGSQPITTTRRPSRPTLSADLDHQRLHATI